MVLAVLVAVLMAGTALLAWLVADNTHLPLQF